MEVGLVRSVDIDQEMQDAYLNYAMSVIVARALPDARDGLKPVHRRILYAMYDMGLRPDTAYKKSARIVGEVLGKYHPHGDAAVYESMARMAQDFSMRTLLVEGQGNFGSVDGDPPAAMRYTEARLSSPAMDMLTDIRKNTVNFTDNFDGSLTEPDVLPASLPNLLVNGATGIAVGMSTNIPPHNLGEVVDALIYMLERWGKVDDINVEDLMHFIQGPDFPTGGLILQQAEDEDIKTAYGAGRGRVVVQARAHLEEMGRGRSRIIVTELPYMTNKSSLIERIAELARDGRLEGLADLRDESDRQGLRIVIELTKTADPHTVLKDLYKNTPMRSTFGIIMLALVDGEPRMLSLKQALRVYLEHRLEVIRRRSEFDLTRARERAHILEGLRIALQNLEEIIEIIRKAPDVETARQRMIKRFKLSEIQAQAILDMQLRRLAALERKKIEDEYKELQATIKGLEALLKSPVKMREVVADELRRVKETYADRRRTQIVRLGAGADLTASVLASSVATEQQVWVSISAEGMLCRTHDAKAPRLSGVDAPRWTLRASTRDVLYLVAENGETAAALVEMLPEAASPAEGGPMHKLSALSENDKLAAVFSLPPRVDREENQFVLTGTIQGLVKKSAATELPGPSTQTFTLVKVNEEDKLGWVRLTDGSQDVLLATADGMAIRFKEDEVRVMGLVAAGVGGIKLQARDEIVGLEILPPAGEVLLVSSDGRAKRVSATDFPVQGRYGQGVVAWKLPRTAQVAGSAVATAHEQVTLYLEKLAARAIRFDETPLQTRAAQGKTVIEVKAGDRVLGVSAPWGGEAGDAGAQAEEETPIVQESFAGLLIPAAGKAAATKTGKATTKTPASKPAAKSKTTPVKGKTGAKETPAAAAKKPATKTSAAGKPAAQTTTAQKTSGKTASAKETAPKTTAPAKAKTGAKETPAAPTATAAAQKPAAKGKAGPKETPAAPAKKPAAKTTAASKTAPAKETPAEKKPARKTTAPSPAEAPAKTSAKKTPAKATPAPTAEKKPAGKTTLKPAAETPASPKPAPAKKPAGKKPT